MPTPLLFAPLSPREAALKNPLALAFLGDTVWDLLVRSRLLLGGVKPAGLHREAAARVNAAAQARAMAAVEGSLTEAEGDVARRAQNAHCRHAVPRNQRPYDYARASALEAVLGYLALSGQEARARALFDIAAPILYNEGYGTDEQPGAAKEDEPDA